MHDDTTADDNTHNLTGFSGASTSEAVSNVASASRSLEADASTATSQSVLYGRCLSENETGSIMSPDQDQPASETPSTGSTPNRATDGGVDETTDNDGNGSNGGGVRTRVREESEEDATVKQEAEDEDEHAIAHCPECNGRIVGDTQHGEKACKECGLVIEESQIDHGPEWRAFNAQETNDRRRVGSPSTLMQHDRGLSTNIGHENRDAYGRSLSPKKRRTMSRLRKWNERFRTRDSEDRNLKTAMGEIKRLKSELDLGYNSGEEAARLYRRCLSNDLIRGRSIEAMAHACVFITCRQENIPRTLDRIASLSQVDRQKIARAHRYINSELGLEIAPPNPVLFVQMVGSSVEASNPVRGLAEEMVEELAETGQHSGKHPVGIAASAIYAADEQIAGGNLTQKRVAEVVDITEVTVRERRADLVKTCNPETVERYRERYNREEASAEGVTETTEVGAASGDSEADEGDDVSAETESGSGAISAEASDGATTTLTVDFGAGDGTTQAEVLIEGAQQLVDEYGLIDALDGEEFVAPRCRNPLVVPDERTEGMDFGTWHRIGGDMYINTKLNTRDKKTRLQQLGEAAGVNIEIQD